MDAARQRSLELAAQSAAEPARVAVDDRDGSHARTIPSGMARSWRRRLRIGAEILVIALGIGALGLWCSVPDTSVLETRNPTSTAFIDLRREQNPKLKLDWQWRPLAKISRYLRAAVVYSEDWNFYTHDGVDWSAIQGAFEHDALHGSLGIGGSTITQQVAKNLYLSPSRNPTRKLREILIAFSLEDHLTKTRILELYLNICEWGDGVFGAEAASRTWFGRSAASITPAQAARLAVALPNPIERSPAKHDAALTKKAVRLIGCSGCRASSTPTRNAPLTTSSARQTRRC